MNRFKILISIVTIAFVSVFLLAVWSFWEPSGIKKGSIAYTLKVPSDAKTFPLWGVINVPEFDVNVADGEKPSATVLHYNSSLQLKGLTDLAAKLGFGCKRYETTAVLCDKKIDDRRAQQIIFQKNTESEPSQVRVLFIGY